MEATIMQEVQLHQTISRKAACACPHCSNELYVSIFQSKENFTSVFCTVCDFIGDMDKQTFSVLSVNHAIQY